MGKIGDTDVTIGTTYNTKPLFKTTKPIEPNNWGYYAAVTVPLVVAGACAASFFVKTRHSQLVNIFAAGTLINLAGNALSAWTIRKELAFKDDPKPWTIREELAFKDDPKLWIMDKTHPLWPTSLVRDTAITLICNSAIVGIAVLCRKTNPLSARQIAPWLGGATILQLGLRYLVYKGHDAKPQTNHDTISQRYVKTSRVAVFFPLITTATISAVMLFGRFKALKAA